MEEKYMVEIDLWELLRYLKKKILVIAGVTVICALLGLLYSTVILKPQYTASTRVYMLHRTSANTIAYADIQTSTFMLLDYQVLITGQNVTREVIRDLNLDMTDAQLAKCIEVSAETNTRILQIDVTHNDPQLAADIANRVREIAAEQIKEIMEVDAVKTVYEAETPKVPVGLDICNNILLAAILGLLASGSIYTVRFVLDDTIRTEEDVERYLNLSVLAVIPESEELQIKGKYQVKRKKNFGKKLRKAR